jgi:hypothetical protein
MWYPCVYTLSLRNAHGGEVYYLDSASRNFAGSIAQVRFSEGTSYFYLLQSVETGSGAHPAFYPMGTGGSFLGGMAAGT